MWDIEKTDEGNGAIQIVTQMIGNTDLKHYGGVVAIKSIRQMNNLKCLIIDQVKLVKRLAIEQKNYNCILFCR